MVPSPEEHQCSVGNFKEQSRAVLASCTAHKKAGRYLCVCVGGSCRTHPVTDGRAVLLWSHTTALSRLLGALEICGVMGSRGRIGRK